MKEPHTPLNPAPTAPTKPDPDPPRLIDVAEFSKIEDANKPGLMGGAHATFMNHKGLSESMQKCRLLGYEAAHAAGRSPWDVVVVLAHNDPNEMFFKDHEKLSPKQREYMTELLSIEETVQYEELKGVAKLEFERDWATARWRWKRYSENFAHGAPWATWWMYRDDVKKDPLHNDAKHPLSATWQDFAELVGPRDGVKFLVLYGNMASVQICVFRDDAAAEPIESEVEAASDAAPGDVVKTADDHIAELRAASATG